MDIVGHDWLFYLNVFAIGRNIGGRTPFYNSQTKIYLFSTFDRRSFGEIRRAICIWFHLVEKNLSELTDIHRDFIGMIKIQYSQDTKIFRTDNVMKYNKKRG